MPRKVAVTEAWCLSYTVQGVRVRGTQKIHAYILVPKSFMKFIFSTVYRVTQKDLYACPYTSVWAPVVARKISKRYSSSCHVFISMWGVISSTASTIRCLKSATSRTFLLYTTSLINPHPKKKSNGVKSGDLGGQAVGPPLPTQRPGKVSSKNVVTSLWQWGWAPSYNDLEMLTIKSRRFSIDWAFTLQYIYWIVLTLQAVSFVYL